MAVDNMRSEMRRFWLRKSHQPVLAILAVQKPKQSTPTYYRGVNAEVSMPTGSLCAERNAIGTALASDPSLRREHFKMVAVLFMPELLPSETRKEASRKLQTAKSQPRTLRFNEKNKYDQSRSISVPSKAPKQRTQRTKSYLVPTTDDVNPRGPCGSCLEWLGKIAQCNPSFKIITFSNRDLREVIVRNLS
eukprot:181677_1